MLLTVLDSLLLNNWNDPGLYEMLAVEILRKEKELSLSELFHTCFKLTLFGVQSTQLRDAGFRRASKSYSTELKRL